MLSFLGWGVISLTFYPGCDPLDLHFLSNCGYRHESPSLVFIEIFKNSFLMKSGVFFLCLNIKITFYESQVAYVSWDFKFKLPSIFLSDINIFQLFVFIYLFIGYWLWWRKRIILFSFEGDTRSSFVLFSGSNVNSYAPELHWY
jgi:hypothetical protein